MWHHQSWNLPESPDIVTFSKKMQTGGFYFKEELKPTEVIIAVIYSMKISAILERVIIYLILNWIIF